MLPTRSIIFGIEMGAPSRYVYDNFDVVGYDVGFASKVQKIGFTKNTISTKVKGFVGYETELQTPFLWSKLAQRGVVNLNGGSSLLSQVKHIPLGQPVEIVLYPDKGHIGFWTGSDGFFELGVACTKDNTYITLNKLYHFLGWQNADLIAPTKSPISLDTVLEINLLG